MRKENGCTSFSKFSLSMGKGQLFVETFRQVLAAHRKYYAQPWGLGTPLELHNLEEAVRLYANCVGCLNHFQINSVPFCQSFLTPAMYLLRSQTFVKPPHD